MRSEGNLWLVRRPAVEMTAVEVLNLGRSRMRIEEEPFRNVLTCDSVIPGKEMRFSKKCIAVDSQGSEFAGNEAVLKRVGWQHPTLAELLWLYVSYSMVFGGGSTPFFGKHIISSCRYPGTASLMAVSCGYTQAINFKGYSQATPGEFAFLTVRVD